MDKEIIINGVEYIAKSEIQQKKAKYFEGMEYKVIRTYSAGVHAGYLKDKKGDEITLVNSRRLWKWAGAESLSELSQFGTRDSENCKFACEVNEIILLGVIEIISCTEQAQKSIQGVKKWKA